MRDDTPYDPQLPEHPELRELALAIESADRPAWPCRVLYSAFMRSRVP
ncbi:MAG: hypothetical protein ABI726_05145 [bacterium]